MKKYLLLGILATSVFFAWGGYITIMEHIHRSSYCFSYNFHMNPDRDNMRLTSLQQKIVIITEWWKKFEINKIINSNNENWNEIEN